MSVHQGYRVVAFNPETQEAYTLQDKHPVDLKFGSYINHNRLFLGTDKGFTEYYLGNTDHVDLILTYTYHDRDVVEGNPNDANSEVVVKDAYLVDVEIASPDDAKYQKLVNQQVNPVPSPSGQVVKVLHKQHSETYGKEIYRHVANVIVTPEDDSYEALEDALMFAYRSTTNINDPDRWGCWSKPQYMMVDGKVCSNPSFNPFITVTDKMRVDSATGYQFGLRSTDLIDDVFSYKGKNYKYTLDGFTPCGVVKVLNATVRQRDEESAPSI